MVRMSPPALACDRSEEMGNSLAIGNRLIACGALLWGTLAIAAPDHARTAAARPAPLLAVGTVPARVTQSVFPRDTLWIYCMASPARLTRSTPTQQSTSSRRTDR